MGDLISGTGPLFMDPDPEAARAFFRTKLRAQVSKLKEELNIARRIEWIRQGIFANAEQKGAQKLMQGVTAPQMQARTAKPAYDLNVEVNADGSVKVIPPLAGAGATNSPPAK